MKNQISIRPQAGGQHHAVDIPVRGPAVTLLRERLQPEVLKLINQREKSLEIGKLGLEGQKVRKKIRMLLDSFLDDRKGMEPDGEP